MGGWMDGWLVGWLDGFGCRVVLKNDLTFLQYMPFLGYILR